MEHDHEKRPAEKPANTGEGRLQRAHPARPEQLDASFAKGIATEPGVADDAPEPDFTRGVRTTAQGHERGRFSRGIEADPDSPEKHVDRRFSQGIEHSPGSQ